jgi:hypothetical protein
LVSVKKRDEIHNQPSKAKDVLLSAFNKRLLIRFGSDFKLFKVSGTDVVLRSPAHVASSFEDGAEYAIAQVENIRWSTLPSWRIFISA